jgi:uncharacterized membrane-anchored protein YitT (DUF2179 family)
MFTSLCFALLVLTMPSEGMVEAKIVAISIAVSALLQVCKKAPVLAPFLQGWTAVVVNIVLSIVGVYAVVQPADVFSLNTFVTVLTAALAAAGVHGTTTKLMARSAEKKAAAKWAIAESEKRAAFRRDPMASTMGDVSSSSKPADTPKV